MGEDLEVARVVSQDNERLKEQWIDSSKLSKSHKNRMNGLAPYRSIRQN